MTELMGFQSPYRRNKPSRIPEENRAEQEPPSPRRSQEERVNQKRQFTFDRVRPSTVDTELTSQLIVTTVFPSKSSTPSPDYPPSFESRYIDKP